jgi:hypothetical protein
LHLQGLLKYYRFLVSCAQFRSLNNQKMKHINYIPTWTFLICSFMFVFAVTACSDDDTDDKNEEETFNQLEENLALDTMRQELLISQLCDEEELLDGRVIYTPRYGEALHVATPTIYYVGIDTILKARAAWQNITSAVRDSASAQTLINEVRVLNTHLSYTEGGSEGEFARIDVECPELANVLTSIVFIPIDRWPSNDQGSPFGFLSVWKDSTGYYYVCVQKALGCNGILLSFDGEWRKKFIWYSLFNSTYIWKQSMARGDAFDALANCISYNPTQYNKALEELARVAGTNNNTYRKLKECATSPTGKMVCFNNDYTIEGHIFSYRGIMNNSAITDRYYYKTDKWYKTCMHWSSHFGKGWGGGTVLHTPSRAIYFKPDFNNKEGWTCIFRGT